MRSANQSFVSIMLFRCFLLLIWPHFSAIHSCKMHYKIDLTINNQVGTLLIHRNNVQLCSETCSFFFPIAVRSHNGITGLPASHYQQTGQGEVRLGGSDRKSGSDPTEIAPACAKGRALSKHAPFRLKQASSCVPRVETFTICVCSSLLAGIGSAVQMIL